MKGGQDEVGDNFTQQFERLKKKGKGSEARADSESVQQ